MSAPKCLCACCADTQPLCPLERIMCRGYCWFCDRECRGLHVAYQLNKHAKREARAMAEVGAMDAAFQATCSVLKEDT